MGMFDSLYDAQGNEWQTKHFGRSLERWNIGDRMPQPGTYQLEVIGGPGSGLVWSLATVRDGVLVSAGDARDWSLPVLEYSSGWRDAERQCPVCTPTHRGAAMSEPGDARKMARSPLPRKGTPGERRRAEETGD